MLYYIYVFYLQFNIYNYYNNNNIVEKSIDELFVKYAISPTLARVTRIYKSFDIDIMRSLNNILLSNTFFIIHIYY